MIKDLFYQADKLGIMLSDGGSDADGAWEELMAMPQDEALLMLATIMMEAGPNAFRIAYWIREKIYLVKDQEKK